MLHTLGYLNPLTAAPVAGMDAFNEFRQGNVGRGLVNSVWALASLIPGSTAIRGLAGAGRLGRALAGKGPAFVVKGLKKPGTGILGRAGTSATNAWRRVVNPVKIVGNAAVKGLASGAPELAGAGNAIDALAKGGIKNLSDFWRKYPASVRTIKTLQTPALVASFAMPMEGPSDIARTRPALDSSRYKQAQSVSVADLLSMISSDPSLSPSERSLAVSAVRSAFPGSPSLTFITPGTAGAAGAVVAWLVTKYMGLPVPVKALAAFGGFGLGKSVYGAITNPYPGYRSM